MPLSPAAVDVGGGAPPAAWPEEVLELLRMDAARRVERAEGAPVALPRLEVLAFEACGETFAVGIGDVVEILLPRAITPLPRTPPFVLGVASLRGAVLPVCDLARRLRLPEGAASDSERIVVLRDGDECLGFRVDRVRGVLRFREDEVRSSEFSLALDPQFLHGIAYDGDGGLVAVLRAASLCDFQP